MNWIEFNEHNKDALFQIKQTNYIFRIFIKTPMQLCFKYEIIWWSPTLMNYEGIINSVKQKYDYLLRNRNGCEIRITHYCEIEEPIHTQV